MQERLRQQTLPGVMALPARVSLTAAIGKTIAGVIESRSGDSVVIVFDDQSFAYVSAEADFDDSDDVPATFVTMYHEREFGPSFHEFAVIDFDADELRQFFPAWAFDMWLKRTMNLQVRPKDEPRDGQQHWFDM